MAAIEIRNAHKDFGSARTIDGLDLSIDEGQVCAFLGHNGAGKTTTLRLLPGLLEPDGGTISLFGMSPIKDGDKIRGCAASCPRMWDYTNR
jgi:ABC-2 type transport system ATP-binding protein